MSVPKILVPTTVSFPIFVLLFDMTMFENFLPHRSYREQVQPMYNHLDLTILETQVQPTIS